MFAFLKGVLVEHSVDTVIIEVNSIGYNVFVSTNTISALPNSGENITLYTYTCVREDAFLLYGFLRKDELEIFKKCISVNGVGPKSALGILSIMDASAFRYAIHTKDAKAIAKAPGIGSKTAERIIIDLKDKFNMEYYIEENELTSNDSFLEVESKQESIEALVALGYHRSEVIKVMSKMENIQSMNTSEILKEALKHLF